jgi:sulfate adenylyltransferase subunit 1
MIRELDYKLDVNTLQHIPVEGSISLNEIVKARLRSARPLVADRFNALRSNGAAILVDETSNNTVAAVIFQ